jgi:hypothetical protein
MEEWREANIFPGRYLVSNLGRIRQVVRYDSSGRKAGGRIIKQDKRDKDGYRIVQLQYKGVIKWPKVHRLVAQAFIENPENKPYVDHINTNRRDNRAENLRWVTAKENIYHARRMGSHKSDGQKKVAQFDKNGMLRCVFSSATEASKKTGIARCNISAVARGNTRAKTAGGYIWRYI